MDHYNNTEGLVQDFRQQTQLPGKSIDSFHTRLQQMAALCDFHDVTREVCSQIISGCAQHKVRLAAMNDKTLTLAKILNLVRNREVASQLATQMEEKLPKTVSHVSKQKYKPQPSQKSQNTKSCCWFCGGAYPHRDKCPAKGKLCNGCGKVGHFEVACRGEKFSQESPRHPKSGRRRGKRRNQTQHVKHVAEQDSSSSSDIFAIHRDNSDTPMTAIKFGDEASVDMVVDSGCPRDIIGEDTYRKFSAAPTLHATNIKLYPYCSTDPLNLVGKFKSRITCGKRTAVSTVYVMKGNATGLLSAGTSKALDLLQLQAPEQVHKIETQSTSLIVDEYQDRFKGIGKLVDFQVKLHVDPNVEPVAQNYRRMPYSMCDAVSDKLNSLMDDDIIEKVSSPTPWVSPIFCAPKPKNPDEIRLFVDMRSVNTAIQRVRHPTPTISEIIADVNGAKHLQLMMVCTGING